MGLPIYQVKIHYEVFKYRTKKGRRYLSKIPSVHICETSSTIKDVTELNNNKGMLSRLSTRANFNPWSEDHKIVVKKVDILSKHGETNYDLNDKYKGVDELYKVLSSSGDYEEDLKLGEENEMIVSKFLEGKGMKYISSCTYKNYDLLMSDNKNNEIKFEVKTDVLVTKDNDTGNVAIEIRYKGEPSGVSSTEAKWFVYYFANLDKENLWMISVDNLKKLIKNNKFKIVKGGDNNNSELVLIKRYNYISKFKVYNLCREENTKGKNL